MFDRPLRKVIMGGGLRAPARCGSPAATEKAFQRGAGICALVAVLGIFLVLGTGCSTSRESWAPTDSQTEEFFSKVRPASGDTSRLLQNAHYYQLMGRPQLALKELEEAHQLDPDNLKIVNTLAHSYEELGQFPRAQKLYQEAMARQGNAALNNNLCFSYYLAGRWEQAEACYREALARDPGNQAARNNLGLLYCRLGRSAEARRLWQEAEGAAAARQKTDLVLASLGMSAPGASAPLQPPASPQQPMAQAPVKTPSPGPAAAGPRASQPGARLAQRAETPARSTGTATPAPPRPVAAAPVPRVVKPQPVTAAPKPRPETGEKTAAVKPGTVGTAAPAKPKLAIPQPSHAQGKPLTAEELVGAAIEVRNGTWTRNLAHQTRAALSQEGFRVTMIGNHIDFGAERTLIYYRPGAERVANSLSRTFFPTSTLAPSPKLRDGVDVKIILGYDLLKRQDLMVQLTKGE